MTNVSCSSIHLIPPTAQRTRVFSAMLEMLRWFAGQQIKNVSVNSFSTASSPEHSVALFADFRR